MEKDKVDFRKWCADRYDKYPITPDDKNKQYGDLKGSHAFYPMVACDECGIIGHFIDKDRKNGNVFYFWWRVEMSGDGD